MQNDAWIRLLQRVPEKLLGKVMLVTTCANEISLQRVYRMESDYMVIRGRMAGTTDAGTLMFVPFDQLNYLGFREEIKEAEIEAMFADTGPAATPAPRVESPAAPVPPPEPPAATAPPVETTPVAPPVPTTTQPSLPGKAALLERLRRARGDSAKPG